MTTTHRTRAAAGLLAAAATGAAATPALAAPQAVTDAKIVWSQANNYTPATARTFLGHTTNPPGAGFASNGTAVISGGASLFDPSGTAIESVTPTSPRGTDAVYSAIFPATGTYDAQTGWLDLQGSGVFTYNQYPSLGAAPLSVGAPRLVWNTQTNTGAVHAAGDGSGPAGPGGVAPAVPYDAKEQTFNLAGSGIAPTATADAVPAIPAAPLAPTLVKAGVYPGNYTPGTAGPDRSPNTFGTFGAAFKVTPAAPAPAPQTPAPATSVPATTTYTVTLTKQPFKAKRAIGIKLRKRGSFTILGDGSVKGKTLTVTVPTSTELTGDYVLRRVSKSSILPKSKVVTVK